MKAPHRGRSGMTSWKGKSVLVTGATGLVGSWLVRKLLEEGAYVSALVLDMDPSSELIRSGDFDKLSVINGTSQILTRSHGQFIRMRARLSFI